MSQRIIAILQATGILILLSIGTILNKIVLASISPLTFAWVSVGIGMLALSFYTFLIKGERIPRNLNKQIWFFIAAIGIGNFLINRLARPYALDALSVTTNTYIGNFVGFITMGMSILILKEAPSIFQIIGGGIAFLGIAVYFNNPPQNSELLGIIFIIIGITAVAYTNNIARKLAIVTNNGLSNNSVSTAALLIGGAGVVLIGLIFDFPPAIPDLKTWEILLYEGVVNIALGLTVWNYILRTLRSYEASILGASTIIWTTLLAIIVLGEKLTIYQAAGMGLMGIGFILVQIRRGQLNLFGQEKYEHDCLQQETQTDLSIK